MNRIHVRMRARDPRQAHRASSPLELLFDLTFVAAISIAASGFAHSAESGHPAIGVFAYVFFAVWWAWMNFTWFASAYDTDDVPYRLLTVLQMAGVLVLAAGVAQAYAGEGVDSGVITLGYVVMRLALVGQWLRAALASPETRTTCLRYVAGISVVQVGWGVRLLLPEELVIVASALLAVLELTIPVWAEWRTKTTWHPGHISERYGLFVIILLGEGVLGATAGIQNAVEASDAGLTPSLVAVGVLGLLVVVALWWLYFLVPSEEGLARHRARSYLWGYGHYVLLGCLALVSAGLEVAVVAVGHHEEGLTPQGAVAAIAWPAAIVLAAVVALNAPLLDRAPLPWVPTGAAVVLLALVPLLGAAGVVTGLAAVALILAALIAATLASRPRTSTA